jgi:HK97 gp10 family phage protein
VSDALSMSVTGIDALDKALLELEGKLAKKVVTQAMRKTMKGMKRKVEELAPVGEGPGEHGSFADNVKIKSGPRKKYVTSIEIQVGDQPGEGKGNYWVPMVEYGTSKQPPQHKTLKAFDEDKARCLDDFAKEVLAGLEKLVAEAR